MSTVRVIAIGKVIERPSGQSWVVTSVELWPDYVAVVSAGPPGVVSLELLAADELLPSIQDDLGTEYRLAGSTFSQAPDGRRRNLTIRQPGVPANATRLYIGTPANIDAAPFEITL